MNTMRWCLTIGAMMVLGTSLPAAAELPGQDGNLQQLTYVPTELHLGDGVVYLYPARINDLEDEEVVATSLLIFQLRSDNVPRLGSVTFIGTTYDDEEDEEITVRDGKVVDVWLSQPVPTSAEEQLVDGLEDYLADTRISIPNDREVADASYSEFDDSESAPYVEPVREVHVTYSDPVDVVRVRYVSSIYIGGTPHVYWPPFYFAYWYPRVVYASFSPFWRPYRSYYSTFPWHYARAHHAVAPRPWRGWRPYYRTPYRGDYRGHYGRRHDNRFRSHDRRRATIHDARARAWRREDGRRYQREDLGNRADRDRDRNRQFTRGDRDDRADSNRDRSTRRARPSGSGVMSASLDTGVRNSNGRAAGMVGPRQGALSQGERARAVRALDGRDRAKLDGDRARAVRVAGTRSGPKADSDRGRPARAGTPPRNVKARKQNERAASTPRARSPGSKPKAVARGEQQIARVERKARATLPKQPRDGRAARSQPAKQQKAQKARKGEQQIARADHDERDTRKGSRRSR